MFGSGIEFIGTWPAWLVMIIALAAAGISVWTYRRRRMPALLAGLRVAVIAALALFLMKPVLRVSRESSERRTVIVLQDASESMGIRDALEGTSRLETSQRLLESGPYDLSKRLKRSFEVRHFVFGARAEADDGEATELDAGATALGDSLRQAVAAVGASNAAAVILLSDGVQTVGENARTAAEGLGVPVYAIEVGGRPDARGEFVDVGISAAPRNQELILNNEAVLRVSVNSSGLSNVADAERRTQVSVLEGERTLCETSLELPAEAGSREIELKFVPKEPGLKRLTAVVSELPGESVVLNNRRDFTVRVSEPRIRVLIVEGVARNEYRFLRRVLGSDPDISLSDVVKLRKDVFLQQDVDSGADLSRGLPSKSEDFKRFDVILMGDIARSEFSDGQLEALRSFVSEGGGLILTGGRNAYGAGGYSASAVADLLPVLISDRDGHTEGTFVPRLTSVGTGHPVFRGSEKFFSDAASRAAVDGANRVSGVKAGASVLAVHPGLPGQADTLPVVAAQQYGRGMVLALTIDTTWKWKFQMEGMGLESPYYRFWRQSVRWLAGRDSAAPKAGEKLAARTDKGEYKLGEVVNVEVAVRNAEGEPVENGIVEVDILPPGLSADGPETAAPRPETGFRLLHQPLGLGAYAGTFEPKSPGLYRVHISSASAAGGRIGEIDIEFVVGRSTGEFDRVDVDEPLLRAIAAESGGEFHTPATASRIPDQIDQRKRRVRIREERTLWNAPSFFMVFLGCISAEWFLRRRLGMS